MGVLAPSLYREFTNADTSPSMACNVASTLNDVCLKLLVCSILVQAYKRGLKYPRFTFLHAAWWSDQWWRGSVTEGHNCTVEEREAVVEYSLAVLLYEHIENDDDIAETGLVSYKYNIGCSGTDITKSLCLLHQDGHTFRRRFAEHFRNFEAVNLPADNPLGPSCYDATWILALALNKTIKGT